MNMRFPFISIILLYDILHNTIFLNISLLLFLDA